MPEATRIGQRVVPALLVRDMAEILTFYQRLGFAVTGAFPNEEAPVWAEVKRDAVVFQFYTEPACGTPPEPVCSGTFYIYPESVTALAEELHGRLSLPGDPR